MNGSGLLRVDAGATTTISASVSLADTRRADVAGTMALAGDNSVGFSDTALIHVLAGGALRKTVGTTHRQLVRLRTGAERRHDRDRVRQAAALPGLRRARDGHVHGPQRHPAPAPLRGRPRAHGRGPARRLHRDRRRRHGPRRRHAARRRRDLRDVERRAQRQRRPHGHAALGGRRAGRPGHDDGGARGPDRARGLVLRRQPARRPTGSSTRARSACSRTPCSRASATRAPSRCSRTPAGSRSTTPLAGDCDTSGISSQMLVHNTGTIEKLGGTGEAELTGDARQRRHDPGQQGHDDARHERRRPGHRADRLLHQRRRRLLHVPAAACSRSRRAPRSAARRVSRAPTCAILDGVTVTVPAGGTLTHTDGTISGAGTLRILGALDWRGGEESGPGTTVIEPGGERHDLPAGRRGHRLRLAGGQPRAGQQGNGHGTDSELAAFDGAAILNRGVIALTGAATSTAGRSGPASAGCCTTSARCARRATSTVSPAIPTDNDGTIEVSGGTLDATALLNSTEDFGDAAPGRRHLCRARGRLARRAVAAGHARRAPRARRRRLQGRRHDFGSTSRDALAGLRRIAGNGELELSGGRALSSDAAADGTFTNAGVLGLGAGSTFTAAGGYAQTRGRRAAQRDHRRRRRGQGHDPRSGGARRAPGRRLAGPPAGGHRHHRRRLRLAHRHVRAGDGRLRLRPPLRRRRGQAQRDVEPWGPAGRADRGARCPSWSPRRRSGSPPPR